MITDGPDEGAIVQHVPFGNKSTILEETERQVLEMFEQRERVPLLKEMRSYNKSANRRAKKKIADASRRRNRR